MVTIMMNPAEQAQATSSPPVPAEAKKQKHNLGCGFLGRFPILSILAFALAGVAAGIGLSMWVPETEAELSQKQTALQWIGLVGDLFIRALKCVM